MKSSLRSDEIFGVMPQMKLNPSSYPNEVGFHHEVISSHDNGIYPNPNSWRRQLRTDLVEKIEQVFDLLYFFKSVLTKKERSSKIIVYIKLRMAVRKIKRLARLDVG